MGFKSDCKELLWVLNMINEAKCEFFKDIDSNMTFKSQFGHIMVQNMSKNPKNQKIFLFLFVDFCIETPKIKVKVKIRHRIYLK